MIHFLKMISAITGRWFPYLVLGAFLLGTAIKHFNADAKQKQCFLSYDASQTLFVDCRIGAKPPEYTRVCRMVDGERDGSLYNAEIVTRDADGDILTSRQWNFSEVLAPGESILCSISQTRKQAKEDARLAKEAEEKAKKDKRKSDWDALCASPKAGLEALLCEERGY